MKNSITVGLGLVALLSSWVSLAAPLPLRSYRLECGTRQTPEGTLILDSSAAPKEFVWQRYAVNQEAEAFRPLGRYRLNFRCKVEGFGEKAYLFVLVRPYSCVGSEKDVLSLVVNPKPGEWQTFSVPVNAGRENDYRLQFHSHNRIRAEIADVTVEDRPPLVFVPAQTKANAAAAKARAAIDASALPKGAAEFDVDLPRPSTDLVLNAADFGVSEAKADNTAALRAAFAAAKARKAAVLKVPRGTYRFTSNAPVMLTEFADLTFDGGGSTFVSHRSSGAFFDIRNCERLRMKDFAIDWDWARDPLASLVKVVRVDASSFDVEFVDYEDFPCKTAAVTIFSAYDPKTKSVGFEGGLTRAFDMGRKVENRVKKTWLDGRTLRVHEAAKGFAPGQLYRLQHYYYHMNGFGLSGNAHLRLENVKVLSTPGHAFVMSGRQHHTLFDHVNIVAPADDPRRVITCTADHLHIGCSQGFIKLESCEFSLGADDIMNMHDNSGFARGHGPKTVRTENAPSYAHLAPGTRVELRRGDYSETGFIGTVAGSKPAPGYRACDLTFEEEIPADDGRGFILFDKTYDTHNVIVRNCFFHDNRARGLLILARDVTVENNVFRHQEMGAIKIETGYTLNLWSEGYGVSNVVIRGNLFDTVNPSGSNASHRERSIYAGIYLRTDPSTDTTDYPIIRDLLIERNTFRDTTGVVAYLSSVHHVTVRDNVIEDPTPRRKECPYRSQFYLTGAHDVRLVDNVYRPSPNVKAPGVVWDSETCSGITATSVVKER